MGTLGKRVRCKPPWVQIPHPPPAAAVPAPAGIVSLRPVPTADTVSAVSLLSLTRARRLTIATSIVAVAVTSDQVTKQWALGALEDGRTIALIPTLEFDLAYNSGFSFSAGSGSGDLIGVLVMVLCGFIAWQIWREARTVRALLYATILGGALGNLVDRVFRADDGFLSGEVIDFIDVSWYAVFNVADMFVVCGCIAFVAHELWVHRNAAVHEAQEGTLEDDTVADDTVGHDTVDAGEPGSLEESSESSA
jgi:signal peptidase II